MNTNPLLPAVALLLAAPLLAACTGTVSDDASAPMALANPYPAPAETPLLRSGEQWKAEAEKNKQTAR